MQEIRQFLFKNMYHNKLILDKLSVYSEMIKKTILFVSRKCFLFYQKHGDIKTVNN